MSEIKIKFNGTELTEFGSEREAVSADGKKICPYCDDSARQIFGFGKFDGFFYIARSHSDGSMEKVKADFCPKCGRRLEGE
jgi:ribosomal protein S27AE